MILIPESFLGKETNHFVAISHQAIPDMESSVHIGGKVRDFAHRAGVLDDFSSILEMSQNFQVLPWNTVTEPPPPKSGSDPWGIVSSIVAGAAATSLVCLGARSVICMMSWRRSLRNAETNEPASGPPPLLILGNMLSLRSNYYKTLYDYVEDPASVFWVLSTPFVVVNDIDASRRVLGGANGLYMKPKYFGYRSKPVQKAVESSTAQVISESVEYSPHGDSSRVALQRMVVGSFDDIKLSMKQLLVRLEQCSASSATNSSKQLLQSMREAIIGLNIQVLFGIRQEGRERETVRIAEMIGYAGNEFAQRMVNPLKVFVDVIGNIRYIRDVFGLISLGRSLCQTLDESVSEFKLEAEGVFGAAGGSKAGLNWVQAWVGKVGKIGKLGKVVGLLMASSQTVPLTAVWMLYLIANNDSVRGQLKDELLRMGVFSVDDLQCDHLDKLVIADAVIKETLRMYPPFPLIQREAQEDDVLAGITVPKGTPVFIVPWLLHRNPKYWTDPHAFKPSRFIDGAASGDAPSDWVYLPFGRGSRMCAGSRLAVTELKVLLTAAVLSYELDASMSNTEAKSVYPPLGMIPDGVKLRVKDSRF